MVLISIAAAVSTACVPSLGPFRLAAAHGSVVDQDSGTPIVGAHVVQWYRGGGFSDQQPTYHLRTAETGSNGAFRFESALAPSPRMWLLKTYGPQYSFYHPDYGLEHTNASGAELALRSSLNRAPEAKAALERYCQREAPNPLTKIACPNLLISR